MARSDDVPIDPSIAAPSPTYGAHQQYSPYGAPPAQDMQHGYAQGSGLYPQTRPDWAGYGGQPNPMAAGHQMYHQQPPNAGQQPNRPTQVYSFVPIPGAQQHKRPRRRYEEIERMYKCGWKGCEKGYGTLNHLNAHVTMQSHGSKRTPEEFKEIRKEWKARKKEEEAQRKAEDERQRQAAAAAVSGAPTGGDPNGGPPGADGQSGSSYAGGRQLPPLGYQPNQYPAPPASGVPASSMPAEYNNSYMHHNYTPASPYGPPPNQMYGQQR
ncbi:C2H2 finger domain transcription factor con7 [Sporothrix epigloea]|uniref:C2H2 finger domain transcription factor con7 n=1 Tax=Sporothrix epigloea TaxID=1892477 RepID=A0ABP0DLX7_9PEZI